MMNSVNAKVQSLIEDICSYQLFCRQPHAICKTDTLSNNQPFEPESTSIPSRMQSSADSVENMVVLIRLTV